MEEDEEVSLQPAIYQALEKQRIGLIRKLFMRARERREQVIYFQRMMTKRKKRPLPAVPCFTEENRNLEVAIDQQNNNVVNKTSDMLVSQKGLEDISQISSVSSKFVNTNSIFLSSTSGGQHHITETSSNMNKLYLQNESNSLNKRMSFSTNMTMFQNQKAQNNSICYVKQPIFHQDTLLAPSSQQSSSSSAPQSAQFRRFPFSYVHPQQIQQQQ